MSISGIGAPNPFGLLPPVGASKDAEQIGAKSPAEDFLEYARMTPAERIRASILDEMGITEEELEQMDPEERKAIEKQIAERTKEKVEQATKNAWACSSTSRPESAPPGVRRRCWQSGRSAG